jgi:serine/threonine protein kinase
MNDLVGSKLGKYLIIEKIGYGAFATVYRSLDTTLHRIATLEVLPSILRGKELACALQQWSRNCRSSMISQTQQRAECLETAEAGCGRGAYLAIKGAQRLTSPLSTGRDAR